MVDDYKIDELLQCLVYYQVSEETGVAGCMVVIDRIFTCGVPCTLIHDHHHIIFFHMLNFRSWS